MKLILSIVWIVAIALGDVGTDPLLTSGSVGELYSSALNGDQEAQYIFGVAYENGIVVEKDEVKSAGWYEKSASQGNMNAQYNLARMYLSGRGVEKNISKALEWLKRAKVQGNKDAEALEKKILKEEKYSYEETPVLKDTPVTVKEAIPCFMKGEIQEIAPVRLVLGTSGCVLDKPDATLSCNKYKTGTVVTSKSKQGSFYKISGIVEKGAWKPFDKEGWICEESVTQP